MTRALALVALLLASCGDAPPTGRIDRIREQADQQLRQEILPLPAMRPTEERRYSGARKPDPFHPG